MSILQTRAGIGWSCMTSAKSIAVFLLLLFSFSVYSQCDPVNGSTGTDLVGSQEFTGRLGMRFTVNSPISVTQLGAFDSQLNGFRRNITVAIVDAGGNVVVPSSGTPLSLFGTIGTYNGSFQMVGGFPAVTLTSGQYTVVAFGYGPGEENGNTNTLDNVAITNNGGGLITHNDSPWDGTAAMGVPTNTHIVGGFHAGNFSFSPVTPVLRTTINGAIITTNNDGTNDTGTITICSGPPSPNVTINAFEIVSGSSGSVKVYQELVLNNSSQSGSWCNGVSGVGCSALPSLFGGETNTFNKMVPSSSGNVVLRFRAYVDIDGDNNLDAGECSGDWAVYTVNFETIPPVFTNCPANIVRNIGRPTICDTIVTWPTPILATDLPCTSPVTVVQTAGPSSGSSFNAGQTYTITYTATDASGNTRMCSFTVNVNDYVNPSLGCKNVNLSLDEECEGELTPTEVLTGWEHVSGIPQIGCESLFDINIKGSNGEDLGNTVGNDQLGKTLPYTITNANGFTCWGDVTILDKIKPTIICPSVPLIVNCLDDISKIAPPAVDDNCSGAKAVLVNEVHEALQCDPLYIGRVTKTWKAVDGAGNESVLLCVQVINLERSSTIGITAPARSVTLECSDNYARDNKGLGHPAPSVTGVPLFGTTPIYPLSQLNMLYCNSTIDYTDVLIVDTKCKKRILRTWSITEWWCSTAVSKFVSMQTIDIVDTTAPVIPAQDDITVTTQTRSCSATVLLPALTITDNCTAVYKVYVNAYLDGVPTGYINGNGGSITLVSGVHTITYSALDECGNQRDMSYRITVQDNTDPVAICDQFATISIKTNGYTEVTAQAIDDGSFDECSAVTLKVRRMEDPCDFGADDGWFDKVGFCCLDANTTRMVQLLVTDAGGNTNICMVSVNVQEKVDPRITCLADITINDCQYTFDPQNPGAYFGEIVIDDNCPANNQLREVVLDNRNQCGIGTVIRTTGVIVGDITYQKCVQTITFKNEHPFYINNINHLDPDDDIVWPTDYTALGQCSVLGLDPAITGRPVFTEDVCDMVGMQYKDAVYPFTTNGACYKIIRTWSVIDWCQTDKDGISQTWSYDQEIKVMDNVIPTITSATTPKLELTYDGLCQDGQIVLTASATDCTPANELRWSWVVTEGGIVFRTGTGSNASGTYPIGIYRIEFTVEDKCGNLAKTGYDFEIRNAKAPTAICKQGLSASLGLMDSDGNGVGDTIMTILKPAYFDNKSSHVCGYPLKLSFSADLNDTIASFSCADRGPQTVQMWVTDVNGNTSYCQTFVDIQDTQGLCPTRLLANVSGKTVKEDNTEIENVIVEMKGSELNPTNSDKNGHYAFAPMPTGGSYQVIPGKDGDDMNGVSTLDIVMIQRHILGMEKLTSPYKLIAADANNSGSITASDLTELRKLVLGLTTSLPNNMSWRFVDAAYQFVDKNDPWLTPFAERYQIDALNSSMDINFVGIKIGDVNGNAKGRNINGSSVEKRSKVNVVMDDRKVEKGDIIEIPVIMESSQTIYGLQTEWQTSGLIIREMREGAVEINGEAYVIRDVHHSGMSIAIPEGKTMDRNEVMFVIEVEAIRSGRLSDMIQLSETVTPEIYVTDMETRAMGISWRTKTETDFRVTGTTPNPWNTNTNITFELPKDGMVTFKVKDYTGRKVISTIDQYGAGQNTIQLSRSDVGHSGVYVYELRYGDKVISGKMILID
jgi:HYR domain/Dockerin type I domain